MKAGLKISADASVVQGPRGLSIKELKFKETLPNGDNVYQIIIENEQVIGELISKKGDKGLKGDKGQDGRGIISTAFNRKENDCRYYDIFYSDNTKEEFFVENGISAYEVALDNGFEGSETEWLKSLRGEPGNFIFTVENGHLILYEADNRNLPEYFLENGHLIMEIN